MRSERIAIVSNLEGQPYKDVRRLWKLFERKYLSKSIQAYSHPHISFQSGTTHDVRQIKRDFESLAYQMTSFEIEVTGARHFRKDVIYLAVKRTRELAKTHKLIHRFLDDQCQGLDELYAPQHWLPHVTLAMEDLTEENFENAWMEFEGSNIRFKQRIHNVCMVKWLPDGRIRIAKRYKL
jgi:2'-5' RNA ligase